TSSLVVFHNLLLLAISGVKRARVAIDDDEEQPSVHVVYSSLTRESKQKLGELLQQWTEWHAKHSPPCYDTKKVLESGEEMYLPALCVDRDNKPSAVFFWMDNQQRSQPDNESTQLDLNSTSVPLYDRAYTFGLTSPDGFSDMDRHSEISNFRCFNCASYNHSLKDCPKPRDSVAVNTAREKHNGQRSKNASSRSLTRYYQDSPRGKYDGLKPGILNAETQKLLGLGELDPPPWLNRMRELGYPPGYLDEELEDKPSGITIFDENEIDKEGEGGEIRGSSANSEQSRKKSVGFPGINAPLPENADLNRWAAGGTSRFDSAGLQQADMRHNNSFEAAIKRDFYHEERRPREDEGPPGCESTALNPDLFGYPHSMLYHRHEYLAPESISRAHYLEERLSRRRDIRDVGLPPPPGCEPTRYFVGGGYDLNHTPEEPRRDSRHGGLWFRDLRDEEGPPGGCEPGFSPSLSGRYLFNYR
ncbi:uncharacterized protein LOC124920962, partial [Impatiens glandulifera]|uniref:uncharacterized protein LOC124920962 n=1 Tax=Impatiens glandulifera TaxID=253017 RepID=UPI001FB19EB2